MFNSCGAGEKALLPAVTAVRNEDWAHGWKQHFGIVRIGPRLVIKPTWEAFTPEPGDALVTLDPGMAFGTGTHGTTRLCLEALAGLFEGSAPPRRVLDVGTGSGILAIAGAALGAEEVGEAGDDLVGRVAQAETRLAERMATGFEELRALHSDTEYKLNALIDTVDKLVRRNGHKA